jgi:NADH-quinone oxidoreductase subunit J
MERQYHRRWWAALLSLLGTGALFGWFLTRGFSSFKLPPALPPAAEPAGNVQQIADTLFSEYLLPFEVASVLLLVAIVGSVIMAKKRVS